LIFDAMIFVAYFYTRCANISVVYASHLACKTTIIMIHHVVCSRC
jgi:hypothetical protein